MKQSEISSSVLTQKNFLAADPEKRMAILFRAVEQSTNVIMITDKSGLIEYVNEQFCRVTGYTEKEVIGKSPGLLKSGELPDSVYKELWHLIMAGKSWRGEFHNRTKSGDYYWALATISPVKDDDGEIIAILGIQEDISQRKEMELQLQQKTKELEETLQRLGQTQGALLQQEKMAGIGQLAAGVAHEINNPLAFIMSNLKTLQTYVVKISEFMETGRELRSRVLKSDVTAARLMAEQIEQQAKASQLAFIMSDLPDLFKESGEGMNRVVKIVEGLRNFARIDQIREKETYDLCEGIRSTLLIAGNEIKSAAEIELELENLPEIEAHGGEINQVLLNILINAVQAIKGKKQLPGKIKIKAWPEQGFVCCSIADDGGGIANEQLEKIFNPFYTTKPVGEGTGLGLSIAYDIIVNRHGGKIWAENSAAGAVFKIKLPLKERRI